MYRTCEAHYLSEDSPCPVCEIERLQEQILERNRLIGWFKSGRLVRLERERRVMWSAVGELFADYEDAYARAETEADDGQ